MGFFAKMKAGKQWKAGKRNADIGNFEEALDHFSDAAKIAKDKKTTLENLSWYYLVMTISKGKSEKQKDAIEAYAKYIENVQNFREECVNSPGVGAIARFNSSYGLIKAYAERYAKYIPAGS